MADVPQSGSAPTPIRPDPARNLKARVPRLLAMVGGLAIGLGALILRLSQGQGLGPATLAILFLALTLFLWGLNAFAFRRVALGGFTLLLFSAAVFGVLFFLGYFLADVIAPAALGVLGTVGAMVRLADLVFLIFAAMTVLGAAGTAFSRNIIYSAWSLLFAFLGVAGLYVFLGSDFLAVAQVVIYVGGILVLILFAIMLTKQIGEDPKLTNVHVGLPLGALVAAGAVGVLSYTALAAPWKTVTTLSWNSTMQSVGRLFLTDYLLPFEIASVVLLAALVGSVVIARKEIKETGDTYVDNMDRVERPDAFGPGPHKAAPPPLSNPGTR
jgi:NAD(P)H-quinone oxidoreductase subunit 6